MHFSSWKGVECVLGEAGIQNTVCVTSAHSFVFSSVTIASRLLFTVNKHCLLMSKAIYRPRFAVAVWPLFWHFRGKLMAMLK